MDKEHFIVKCPKCKREYEFPKIWTIKNKYIRFTCSNKKCKKDIKATIFVTYKIITRK